MLGGGELALFAGAAAWAFVCGMIAQAKRRSFVFFFLIGGVGAAIAVVAIVGSMSGAGADVPRATWLMIAAGAALFPLAYALLFPAGPKRR